jgi:tRNA dimethylallyltransferase
MVGGSGMFIDAVCIGLDDIPANKELRDELNEILNNQGISVLLTELKNKDPEFYEKVDRNNPVRIIRAIEAIRLSGQTFSEMRKATTKSHSFIIKRFIIDHPRDELYQRINNRVDLMMEAGLVEEVKSVFSHHNLNALRTVGYTELIAHLKDEISIETAIDLIKQNSRRYAKRQLTWFRKHNDAVWIPFNTSENMVEIILKKLNKH